MFERFTEQARQVIVLGQDEARALKHDHIGTEHLLLGLLREEGRAASVLESLGVTLEETRGHVARMAGEGERPVSGQIPFTPGAKKALELSLQGALAIGDNFIGTEHLLLGVVRVDEGVAAEILHELGVRPDAVRAEVLRIRTGEGPAPDVQLRAGHATGLLDMLEYARKRLVEEQRAEEAARLGDKQRRVHELLAEVQDDLQQLFPDGLPPSTRGADARRWEYAMRALEGPPATWPERLTEWRRDGWELLTVTAAGGAQLALLERRI